MPKTPPDIVRLAFQITEAEPSPFTRFAREVISARSSASSAVQVREGLDGAIAKLAGELDEIDTDG